MSSLPIVLSNYGQPKDWKNLKNALFAKGYSETKLRENLQISPKEQTAMFFRRTMGILQHNVQPTSTQNSLICLFLLEQKLDVSSLDSVFTKSELDLLIHSKVLQKDGGRVFSNMSILPYQDLLIVCDLLKNQTETDSVFFPDTSSYALLPFGNTTAFPVQDDGRMLDIGTGCGLGALNASKKYKQVIGMDVNSRAVEFAKLNAKINGIEAQFEVCTTPTKYKDIIECKRGFDLINFVFPFIFPHLPKNFPTHSIASTGEELLNQAYGILPDFLSPHGRAHFWHQVPLTPHFMEKKLSDLGLADHLRVVLNTFTNDVTALGKVFIRRTSDAQDKGPPVTRLPYTLVSELSPAQLERFETTIDKIASITEEMLLEHIVEIQPYVSVTSVRTALNHALSDPVISIGPYQVNETIVDILLSIDGKAKIKEILSQYPENESLVLKCIKDLSFKGILCLTSG